MKHQAGIGFTHFLSRTLFSLVAGLIAGLPLGLHAQGTPQKGGTLVMVVQPEPPTLASYQSTSGPVGQVATKVFDGLLEYAAAPADEVALVLVHGGGPKGSGVLTKLRKLTGVTEVKSEEMRASDFPGFVTEEVRHEDVKVDGDATDRDLDGRNDRKDRI